MGVVGTEMSQEAASMSHPLKIFDIARASDRFVYASAPMVRYSKLAFRQTVHEYGVDLSWTPMILAKEFNRSQIARDSDFTTTRNPDPTIVQLGANDPQELARAATLVAPSASGVDLNCGCPQTWACAATLGAALMEKRELVRDMVVDTRSALARDGWVRDREGGKGRSVSVKIRVHKDLRKTVDFMNTVIGDPNDPLVDFITIHPRTRKTPSTAPINTEALSLLASEFGHKVPLLLSGDVNTLSHLPFSNPNSSPSSASPFDQTNPNPPTPSSTKIAGLMSARALLCNPALFAGHQTCPWPAVESFMRHVARAPLPLRLVQHHLGEMCGPGMGPDKAALLDRKERGVLLGLGSMLEVVDFMDEMIELKTGRVGGVRRV